MWDFLKNLFKPQSTPVITVERPVKVEPPLDPQEYAPGEWEWSCSEMDCGAGEKHISGEEAKGRSMMHSLQTGHASRGGVMRDVEGGE